MHFDLKYGSGTVGLDVDTAKIAEVVLPRHRDPLADPVSEVKQALQTPIGTPSLAEMLKTRKPQKLVIIVNDITRPTPYLILLPPLIEAIEEAGIPDSHVTFVIATGIHNPHTPEQNVLVYGAEVCRRF
ncbi:MAG TPA: transcriptional regulator, partial [Spirochaetaceae bacterium]|nr:transcriptional regulator [Spirochaetaceae bacterium]